MLPPVSWHALQVLAEEALGTPAFRITYQDEDDDRIAVNSDFELTEALSIAGTDNVLRLHVHLTQDFQPPPTVKSPLHIAPPSTEKVLATLKVRSKDRTKDKVRGADGQHFNHHRRRHDHAESLVGVIKALIPDIAEGVATRLQAERCSPSLSPPAGVLPAHTGVVCTECQADVRGDRFRCLECAGTMDLCFRCEPSHDRHHVLLKIREPLPAARLNKLLGSKKHKKDDKSSENKKDKSACTSVPEETRTMAWMPGPTAALNLAPSMLCDRLVSSACSNESDACSRRRCLATAEFVADHTYPDGSTVCPGHLMKQWEVCNPSGVAWPEGTRIVFMQGNLLGTADSFAVPLACPGETVGVRVHLNVPSRPGKYMSVWQLSCNNQVFGHRLWCDVVVPDAAVSTMWSPVTTTALLPTVDHPAPFLAPAPAADQEPAQASNDPVSGDGCLVDTEVSAVALESPAPVSPVADSEDVFDSYLMGLEASSSCEDFVIVGDETDVAAEAAQGQVESAAVSAHDKLIETRALTSPSESDLEAKRESDARSTVEQDFQCVTLDESLNSLLPSSPALLVTEDVSSEHAPFSLMQFPELSDIASRAKDLAPTAPAASWMSPLHLTAEQIAEHTAASPVVELLVDHSITEVKKPAQAALTPPAAAVFAPQPPQSSPILGGPRPLPASVTARRPLPAALALLTPRETALETLVNMGFFNATRNRQLLEAHNDNMAPVIDQLLAETRASQ